jgi:Holliday junction DNA helicase RuvA
MIGYLHGVVVQKSANHVVINVQGVGYEVFCTPQILEVFELQRPISLFIHTHYKSDGVALYGFPTSQEKDLFLSLIKVDSVGPKSALNILGAAQWEDTVSLIEEGDVTGLSKLPKISKKTAEHLVVKLKGKLGDLLSIAAPKSKNTEVRKLRLEASTALGHLGFKPQDVERTLGNLDDEAWQGDLQLVIRHALNHLAGNT